MAPVCGNIYALLFGSESEVSETNLSVFRQLTSAQNSQYDRVLNIGVVCSDFNLVILILIHFFSNGETPPIKH